MVDVVIPSYNRKELLKRAVQSVQNQTFKNWQLWIVDDGSTDNTVSALNRMFSSHPQIHIISLKINRGVSHARNKGIKQGHAKWVALLDSDDKWLPNKLEKQLELAKRNPQLPIIHCNEMWLKAGKKINQKQKHKKQGGRIFIPSVQLCCISPSAVILKRSLLNEVGLFREDFPVCEDYEMWLRITSRYPVGFVDEPMVVKYGGHEDQLSRRYPAMDYWRVKSLKTYLQNDKLTTEERNKVKEVLIKKTQILLKGYDKYQNFKHKEEIENVLKLASKSVVAQPTSAQPIC